MKTLERICRIVGLAAAYSSLAFPFIYNEQLYNKQTQQVIQEVREQTAGKLHYVPWRNLFQGTVIPTKKECDQNTDAKKGYTCQLYFESIDVPVNIPVRTLPMLSRFDEAATAHTSCFLSAMPTPDGLQFSLLYCQKE